MTYARDGSFLVIADGLWSTYDMASRSMRKVGTTSQASDNMFGVLRSDPFAASKSRPLLSLSGVGAFVGATDYSRLPSAGETLGSRTRNIDHLWGLYLK